jgi:hypothetical protein
MAYFAPADAFRYFRGKRLTVSTLLMNMILITKQAGRNIGGNVHR